MIRRDQLQALGIDADTWQEPLNLALVQSGILSDARVAMFLAQCAHESAGFRRLVESLNYSAAALVATWPNRFTAEDAAAMARDEVRIGERAYGGRMGNGPEGSGDGFKFRGRGIIQITGRENYGKCGAALGLNLLEHPELLEEPAAACASAGWYWSTHACNALADAGDFEGITRRINGGLNGLADRQAWLTKVFHALGTQAPAPIEDRSPPQLRQRKGESTMDPLSLISILTSVFAPLIRAKVDKAVGSDVGQPLVDNLLGMASKLTGKADPMEAVAVARQDPAIVQQLQAGAEDWFAQMAPALDKIAAMEAAAWTAEDAGRDAAGVRGRSDGVDIAPTLVLLAGGLVGGVLLFLMIIMGIQTWFNDEHAPGIEMLTLVGPLLGTVFGVLATVYAYRFGSSRQSGAKDLVISEMAKRGKA